MEKNELQVEYWRGEFKSERLRLGRLWKTRLMNSDKSLNNDEGRRIIGSVNDGRGSLLRTVRIVKAMRKIKSTI